MCGTCILVFLRVLREACYRKFILHRSNTSADTSVLTKELYSLGKTCKEKEKVCGFYIVSDFCCHVYIYINATYVYKYRLKTHEHKHRHRYIDCVVEASWLVKWLAWILENILLSDSNRIFSNCDSAISVIHSISNWKLRDADQQKKLHGLAGTAGCWKCWKGRLNLAWYCSIGRGHQEDKTESRWWWGHPVRWPM